MLLSLISDKRKAIEMLLHLNALVKHVNELHEADLEVSHCTEEFILWRIRLTDRMENLAFECPWFTDLNRNPSSGKTPKIYSYFQFSLLLYHDTAFILNISD
jgi:hypothetical protein